jgi:hypothetical protein
MVIIKGNTYPVRRELRALGCDWDKAGKCWLAPDAVAEQAKSLVTRSVTQSRPSRYKTRYSGSDDLEQVGGGRGYQGTDRYGHAHFGRQCGCEDYPCCGH